MSAAAAAPVVAEVEAAGAVAEVIVAAAVVVVAVAAASRARPTRRRVCVRVARDRLAVRLRTTLRTMLPPMRMQSHRRRQMKRCPSPTPPAADPTPAANGEKAAAEATPPPAPAAVAPADIRNNDDWLRLAAGFGENAKALAYHCTFVACEATNGVADKIILRLDKSRGSDLRFRSFLEREIRQRWGAGFGVEISESQTDEARGYYNDRARQAALDAPFIKELMAEFPQARIIADSIKLTQQGDQQL